MVAAVPDSVFADGLYTPEQAARLARLSTRSLRRWLDGEGDKAPALQRSMPKSNSAVVGFVDLIQALAIRAIRKSGKLSLQKVRETIVEAEKAGVTYPFARRHQTFLFSDDVVIKLNDTIIQVTGKYKQQHLLRPVIEVYMDDLTFDVFGLATRYTPLKEDHREIVIDPSIKYGSPVVLPCGFTVGSLISAVESEGSISAAANAYEVEEADIRLALKYDDNLAGIAA